MLILAAASVAGAIFLIRFAPQNPIGAVTFCGLTNKQGLETALFSFPQAPTPPRKNNFFFKYRYYVTMEALLAYPDGSRATGSVNEVFWGEWNPSKQERRLSTKVLIGFPLSNSVSSISILKAEGKFAAFRDNDLYGIERLFKPEKISWSFQTPPPIQLLSDSSP